MEPSKSQRKYEELQRSCARIEDLYKGLIINNEGQDTLQSPKDILLNFFRVCYELKEALKRDPTLPIEFKDGVEKFWKTNRYAALSLDVANQEKHITLGSNNKSGHRIGKINTQIHSLSPDGKPDHTRVTIEIDGVAQDGLDLAKKVLLAWKELYEKI
ncbi:MAG: hypothetical protein WC045_03210 [Patescibacteria group bacterium]